MALIWTGMATELVASLIEGVSQIRAFFDRFESMRDSLSA